VALGDSLTISPRSERIEVDGTARKPGDSFEQLLARCERLAGPHLPLVLGLPHEGDELG
jgi:hypothetical protein